MQWGSGMVVCLEQGADLHTAQLTPLPLTVSCSSKIQIGFTFLVPAHLGSPGKRAVKRECVCVCYYYTTTYSTLISLWHFGWWRGVVVSGVRQWTKLTQVGPCYNWDGWPSSGGYTISGCNQPTKSTQPCIPPGSLNRVPASAGVKAGMSPLPGSR